MGCMHNAKIVHIVIQSSDLSPEVAAIQMLHNSYSCWVGV